MSQSRRVTWARRGYVLTTGVFAVGVIAQVYLAGVAVFVDPAHWSFHRGFVHLLELLLLPMVAFAFLGRLSRSLKLVPIALFLLMALQYATANAYGSLVAAVHPVNAVVIFLVAVAAMRTAWLSATGKDAPG